MDRVRFTLDQIQHKMSLNGNFSIFYIAGWYHDPACIQTPDVKILVNDVEYSFVEFSVERPDVEELFGTLKYTPGFKQNLLIEQLGQTISFVCQNRLIKSVKLSQLNTFRFVNQRKKELSKLSNFLTNSSITEISKKTHEDSKKTLNKQQKLAESIYHQESNREVCLLPTADAWISLNKISSRVGELLKSAPDFKYSPKISILLPVYNGDPLWLSEAIQSVYNQYYLNWELCIADDSSDNPQTVLFLKNLKLSSKIKINWCKKNGKIAEASNSAAQLASGDFVLFMDQDDLLEPNALFEIVRCLQTNPDLDLIYGDEDKITIDGYHYDQHFKPDYSYFLLLAYNYFTHPTCIRRELFEKAGRLRNGFNCAQDYDLILRVVELTEKIAHIPKVLYHWRAIPGSMANQTSDKPEVFASAAKALKEHLVRKNKNSELYQPKFAISNNLPVFLLKGKDYGEEVEIIIFTEKNYSATKRCIFSLIEKTAYKNFKLLIIDSTNNHVEFDRFRKSVEFNNIKIINWTENQNESSLGFLMNKAANESISPYILFLNNNIEIIEPEWLSRMMTYASFEEAGTIGSKIISASNRIIHAGKRLNSGMYSIPADNFSGANVAEVSYFFLAESTSEKIAVSIDCLLTRHSVFNSVGGFDELDFKNNFIDTDYCLKISNLGFKSIFCADAIIMQHEKERKLQPNYHKDVLSFRRKHKQRPDPWVNVNQNLHAYFRPGLNSTLDYCEFHNKPLKLIIFTHNFNWEGAPKVAYNLASSMAERNFEILIVSPIDGPARISLENKGIRTIVLSEFQQNNSDNSYDRNNNQKQNFYFKQLLEEEQADLVFVNVLHSFNIINTTSEMGIPAVWMIHESFTPEEIQFHLPWLDPEDFINAFKKAAFTIFCSASTSGFYKDYNFNQRFRVIRNSLDEKYANLSNTLSEKIQSRHNLNIPDDIFVIVNIAIISSHKNQELLLDAAKILLKEKIIIFLVGARKAIPYSDKMKELTKENNLESIIKIIDETPDVSDYFSAADCFAFPSSNESYPLAILEAMAYGLPIICSPVNGISEQVQFDINALLINTYDANLLANQILQLKNDKSLRIKMGQNSRIIFESMDTFSDMIDAHEKLLKTAWQLHEPKKFPNQDKEN